MGGIASQKTRHKRKCMQDAAEYVLNAVIANKVDVGLIKKLFPDLKDDDDMTNALLIASDIFKSTLEEKDLNKKVRGAEYLRDTAGQKPDTNVTGNVTVEKVFVTKEEEKETLKHIAEVIADKG